MWWRRSVDTNCTRRQLSTFTVFYFWEHLKKPEFETDTLLFPEPRTAYVRGRGRGYHDMTSWYTLNLLASSGPVPFGVGPQAREKHHHFTVYVSAFSASTTTTTTTMSDRFVPLQASGFVSRLWHPNTTAWVYFYPPFPFRIKD